MAETAYTLACPKCKDKAVGLKPWEEFDIYFCTKCGHTEMYYRHTMKNELYPKEWTSFIKSRRRDTHIDQIIVRRGEKDD